MSPRSLAPNRVRALIVSGGNPAAALPDRAKALRASRSLDLLVCIDPRMSDTARLAHYVIALTTMYERADHTAIMNRSSPAPSRSSPPLSCRRRPASSTTGGLPTLPPPPGQPVKFAGRILDPTRRLTSEQMLAMMAERDASRSPTWLPPRTDTSPGQVVQSTLPGSRAAVRAR